jgi:hypothetical protein
MVEIRTSFGPDWEREPQRREIEELESLAAVLLALHGAVTGE